MYGNLDNTAGKGARQERKRLSFVHNSIIVLEGPCSNELPVTETVFERGPTESAGYRLNLPSSLHLATCHLARAQSVASEGVLRTNLKAGRKLRVGASAPGVARHGQTG